MDLLSQSHTVTHTNLTQRTHSIKHLPGNLMYKKGTTEGNFLKHSHLQTIETAI